MKKNMLSKMMICLGFTLFIGYPIVLNGQWWKGCTECEELIKEDNHFDRYQEKAKELRDRILLNEDRLYKANGVITKKMLAYFQVGEKMPDLGISTEELIKILLVNNHKQGLEVLQEFKYTAALGHIGEFLTNVAFDINETKENNEILVSQFTTKTIDVDLAIEDLKRFFKFNEVTVANNLCSRLRNLKTIAERHEFLEKRTTNMAETIEYVSSDEGFHEFCDRVEFNTLMQTIYILQTNYGGQLGGVINVYIDLEEIARDKPKEPLSWRLQDLPKNVYIEYVGMFAEEIMARLNEFGERGIFESIFALPLKKCVHYVLYEKTQTKSYGPLGTFEQKIYYSTIADVLDERNYSIYHKTDSKIESMNSLLPEYWEPRNNYREYRRMLREQWSPIGSEEILKWGCRGTEYEKGTKYSIDPRELLKIWEEDPKHFITGDRTEIQAFLLPAYRIIFEADRGLDETTGFPKERMYHRQFNMIQ